MTGTKDVTIDAAKDTVKNLADKDADSTDSDIRYLAYGARLRTAIRAGTRYIAYTSDVGEAFRPVVPPWVVTAAYGISWLYLAGALPALTIHTAVAQAKKAFKNTKNVRLRTWGPTTTGLALIPILPFLYDHPVEHVTERAFDWIREKIIDSNTKSRGTSKNDTEL
ncbi:hypothetical protein H0H93_006503 [Arthromyces matolae]|nr:hypothetical protein H0H93_006503 [Arthromyces matolae]